MDWAEFAVDSELERDVLRRALPLSPSRAGSGSRTEFDQRRDAAHHYVEVECAVAGPSPSSCLRLLGIRPLLVGTAWKVLDLLLEEAFRKTGLPPARVGRWTIREKVQLAASCAARPSSIDVASWQALCFTYVELEGIRHSLVHRRASVSDEDDLVGVDERGQPIRPLTAPEQEAFARAVLRASELVTVSDADLRVAADLDRQLACLSTLHSVSLPDRAFSPSVPLWVVEVPLADAGYVLDLDLLRRRVNAEWVDVVIHFEGLAGQELEGRLEQAPAQPAQVIDPNNAPAWLS